MCITRHKLSGGNDEKLTLPSSDVLYFELDNGADFVARPSGTEPKIKLYYLIQSDTAENAEKTLAEVKKAVNEYLNV